MVKAMFKWFVLFSFGIIPGGRRLYHYITQHVMGTMESHITKLYNNWPGTVRELKDICGLTLDNVQIWDHEAGWTPFAPLLFYITTGNGGAVVNTQIRGARMLERHLEKSIQMAKEMALKLSSVIHIPGERLNMLRKLHEKKTIREVLDAVNCISIENAAPGRVPLPDRSMDVLLSGGQLEHYTPDELEAFFREAFRILKPGGIINITLDHRYHLYHFDKKIPFLYHYTIPNRIYKITHHGPLLYHNRLLPEDIADMLVKCGFEKIKILRLALPVLKFVDYTDTVEGDFGIERRLLSKSLRKASNSALKTAAGKYIFRKPRL